MICVGVSVSTVLLTFIPFLNNSQTHSVYSFGLFMGLNIFSCRYLFGIFNNAFHFCVFHYTGNRLFNVSGCGKQHADYAFQSHTMFAVSLWADPTWSTIMNKQQHFTHIFLHKTSVCFSSRLYAPQVSFVNPVSIYRN